MSKMGSAVNSPSPGISAWKENSRCTLDGCKTKTIFKTERSYNNHLNNIHLKPLLCSVPRCSYKKPFRNRSDLNRHKATRHSNERPYECPYPTCESETKRFARKDKWLHHIRETQHLNDAFCPYAHCSSMTEFTSRKEISKHFNKVHSVYGVDERPRTYFCSLGACAETIDEHWGEDQLKTHLEACHGLPKNRFLIWSLNGGTERTVYCVSDELQWHDCTICGPQKSSSSLAKNDPVLATLPGLGVFSGWADYRRFIDSASSL
jgi:hypothetical protein